MGGRCQVPVRPSCVNKFGPQCCWPPETALGLRCALRELVDCTALALRVGSFKEHVANSERACFNDLNLIWCVPPEGSLRYRLAMANSSSLPTLSSVSSSAMATSKALRSVPACRSLRVYLATMPSSIFGSCSAVVGAGLSRSFLVSATNSSTLRLRVPLAGPPHGAYLSPDHRLPQPSSCPSDVRRSA